MGRPLASAHRLARYIGPKGLYLAGQDVVTPGIAGALSGGIFGAAAVDPKVFPNIR